MHILHIRLVTLPDGGSSITS